jgi:hypothetical protein
MRAQCLFSGLLMFLGAALAGCGGYDGDYEVSETREVENPRAFPPGIPTTAQRFRSALPRTAHTHDRGTSPGTGPTGFAWDLPEGWTELPKSQFRQGNFRVPGTENVDAYLSVLPGGGGGLLANVNRWRNQMSLPPISMSELEKAPKVRMLGRQATFVELDGTFTSMGGGGKKTGYRLIGLIVLDGQGRAVTMKLVGPAAEVEKGRDAFMGLCRSLRPEAASSPPPAGHDSSGGGLSYEVPEGWQKGAARQMRQVTFHPGEGTETECYISVLGRAEGDAVIAMYMNMWRGQMGREPLSQEKVNSLPKIEVLGTPSPWMEVEGEYAAKSGMGGGGETKEKYKMYVVLVPLQNATVTVKMVGPAGVVTAEKENFLAFCRSLHL